MVSEGRTLPEEGSGPAKSESKADDVTDQPSLSSPVPGKSTIDVQTGEIAWEPENFEYEEPYSFARSCGCPSSFSWRRFECGEIWSWARSNTTDFLAGITTGLTAVPTAVAFAILAGVDPAVGLRGTWIIMLIMALFGSRTGMVYSNSGSMGVVLEPLVTGEVDVATGTALMFYAFMLAGIIQIVLGFFGVAKLLRLMPVSVMIGFVNGLAIVLFLAQMKNFQTGRVDGGGGQLGRRRLNSFNVFTDNTVEWMTGELLGYTLLIVIVTMITIVVYPFVSKKVPKWLAPVRHIPPILVGIIIATVLEWAIIRGAVGSQTRTLTDIAKVKGVAPNLVWFDHQWHMPTLDGSTISKVLGTAISLMAVGLVESLMTVRLVNEITSSSSNIHREAIVGGVGNLAAGAFGGQGGNSEIGLTMVNLKCGGRTRIAATVSGILVVLVVSAAYKLINLIPLAGLVGVMLVIALNTFDWASTWMVLAAALPLKLRDHKAVSDKLSEKRIARADALIIVIVTVATPFTNLAIAVAIGIAVACLAFVWSSSESIDTRSYFRPGMNVKDPAIIKVYEIDGAVFFASSKKFLNLFDHRNDPSVVEVHFHTADIYDYSALEALKTLGERYVKVGKKLRLRRIKKDSLRVITKAQALMTDDLEVIEDDEPELPQPAHGRQNSLMYNFFDRDGYTRLYRHASMRHIDVGSALHAPPRSMRSNSGSNGGHSKTNGAPAEATVSLQPAEV